MTKQEHALMIAIFTKNLQLTHSLRMLLESRGVIDKDDFKAYDALAGQESTRLLHMAEKMYRIAATGLGIEVPPDILESPLQ